MRKSIRAHEAAEWIEDQRDFYVRTSAYCREVTGIPNSFEGWVMEGSEPVSVPRGQMPEDAYYSMLVAMERRRVAYVVLSYGTVIGWQERSGKWHLMPHRYSLTTTQHQWTLWNVVGRGTDTDRVIMDESVKIGRPGF